MIDPSALEMLDDMEQTMAGLRKFTLQVKTRDKKGLSLRLRCHPAND